MRGQKKPAAESDGHGLQCALSAYYIRLGVILEVIDALFGFDESALVGPEIGVEVPHQLEVIAAFLAFD